MESTKECVECKISLPISSFENNIKRGKAYVRNKCYQCRLKRTHQLRQEKCDAEKKVVQSKICLHCNVNKSIEEYYKYKLSPDGHSNICSECAKTAKKTQLQNKNTQNTNVPNVLFCEKCKITKDVSFFKRNSKSKTGFYKMCNACWKPKTWNSEKQKASEKKYVLANPEKMKEKWKRASLRPNRIIRERLNKRISCALQSVNNRKINNTHEYVGCDMKYLKKWFEYHFSDNTLGWHNKGDWHIDHVMPCAVFDLTKPEEQLKCFHWSNLRPCLKLENMEKGDKIIPELIEKHNNLVKEFLKVNPLPNYPSNGDNGAN
jgi:hypothetical protein